MPESPHRPRVTIEDLLRLKRAERPSVEFWTRFENTLREKQLTALLHRRPWWQSAVRVLAQRRAFLPLGATAVIACTLVSVKYFNPAQVARAVDQVQSPTAAGAGQPKTLAPADAVALVTVPANSAAVSPPESVALAPLSANLPERAAELTPWSAPAPADHIPEASIAGNVSRLDPEFDQAVINGRFFATTARQQAPNVTTAELTSVTAVTSKRSRLLAQFGERYYAPEPQAPKIVRDRLTRQLADTDFNDRFSRIGLKGDQVSLKF